MTTTTTTSRWGCDFLEIDGRGLRVSYNHHPGEPATWNCPGEAEHIEIVGAWEWTGEGEESEVTLDRETERSACSMLLDMIARDARLGLDL